MKTEQILNRFGNVKKTGSGWMARCPAHEDKKNSLSVSQENEKTLLKCHAGCETETVVKAAGLQLSDLYADKVKGRDPIIAQYVYSDEQGNPLFRVSRTAGKDFPQERFENGGYVWGLNGTRRVVYNLPEVLKAPWVVVVEGEKDVESLRKIGITATTSPGGAGKWLDAYADSFKDKQVIIFPDNDEPGRQHALKVAASVLPIAEDVKVIELPGIPEKGDVSDYLRDHSKEDLLALIDDAPPFTQKSKREQDQPQSEAAKHHFTLISARDVVAAEDVEQAWIWDGILPAGGMSLLVAKPKVGKTTLAFNLAVAVSRGGEFLNRQTEQGSVVYLALEEKRGEIKKKLTAADISDEPLSFHFGSAPIDAMAQVEALIVETKAKLLVIDVLQKFCRLRDLNDYAIVTNALEPLMAAARKQGCHILLTHHAGKADRPDGDDILGSTGLLGGVDTSIHIKKRDRRRTLFTIQRYGDDVEETVIDLREDGSLNAVGSRQDVEIEETKPLVLEALKGGEALTITDLYERVEKNKSWVSKAVGLLVRDEQIYRSGSGKKKDAYKYSSFPPSDSSEGAKEESKTADNCGESKPKSLLGDFDVFSLRSESSKEANPNGHGNGKGPSQVVKDALDIFGGRILQ
jgi:putative DNA primase/helicase